MKIHKLVRLLSCLLILLLMTGVAMAKGSKPDIAELYVIGVTDFHGHINENDKDPGMAKFAGAIKQEQKQYGGKMLLLSAGDMFQGTMESNLTKGEGVIAMMNDLDFMAMTLGNHEFDWGQKWLGEAIGNMTFPVLSANLSANGTGKTFAKLKPYIISRENGVKVGILGITTPATKDSTTAENLAGVTFLDSVPVINKYVNEMKSKGAEIIIVLTHAGIMKDKNGELIGEAADMARQVKGVDLIVAGHTHQLLQMNVNGINIVEGGKYGQSYAKIKLSYDRKAHKMIDVKPELVQLDAKKLEKDVYFEPYVSMTNSKVSFLARQKIGMNNQELWHERYGDSLLGHWLTDEIRVSQSADVALINGGGIRENMKKGIISESDLYRILPFDNTVVTINLSGRELRNAMEYGLSSNGHGMLCFSGIQIVYDDNRPKGQKITSIRMNDGSSLSDDKLYRVAINDFLADGGDGFNMLKNHQIQNDNQPVLRDVIREAVKRGPINSKMDTRLTIIASQKLAG